MRRNSIGRAWLLAALMALMPGMAFAQADSTGYAPPDYVLPIPTFSTHPESGFFLGGEFMMFHQTDTIKSQLIAVRGFKAIDDSILGPGTSGTFVGSGSRALDTHMLQGPTGYQPGFRVDAGWRWDDGSTLTFDYFFLTETSYRAAATEAPPGLQVGPGFVDSFLFARVYNFPADYNGPPNKINNSNIESAFGIWNGASEMTISFLQRFQQFNLTYRKPVFETEDYRLSGLVGPRLVWIWERFMWRTVDLDPTLGFAAPNDVAIYTNIVSNRMYGVHAGCSNEYYVGHGFAVQVDLEAAAFMNIVKENAKYELGTKDAGPANKRAKSEYTVVPELQGMLGLMWYPTEGIQVQAGYNAMTFFNTIASPQPVSFNYGTINPRYQRAFRLYDGFQFGVAFIF